MGLKGKNLNMSIEQETPLEGALFEYDTKQTQCQTQHLSKLSKQSFENRNKINHQSKIHPGQEHTALNLQ